jgi:hypothetical protein
MKAERDERIIREDLINGIIEFAEFCWGGGVQDSERGRAKIAEMDGMSTETLQSEYREWEALAEEKRNRQA